jgi:hypothetical protein
VIVETERLLFVGMRSGHAGRERNCRREEYRIAEQLHADPFPGLPPRPSSDAGPGTMQNGLPESRPSTRTQVT